MWRQAALTGISAYFNASRWAALGKLSIQYGFNLSGKKSKMNK